MYFQGKVIAMVLVCIATQFQTPKQLKKCEHPTLLPWPANWKATCIFDRKDLNPASLAKDLQPETCQEIYLREDWVQTIWSFDSFNKCSMFRP